MLVSRPQALDTTGLATTEAVEAADNLRVRKGSRVMDVSGLPEPTYTQLGMSYFVLDDGNGFPALATCVTSDADTYTWSLVPFGETVPALRAALDVYSRAQVDASDAQNTQLVGALLSVALNMREMCSVRLDCASRSDTPLSEALPGTFTYSGGTLTAPINGDIREITGISFELGTRFLWRFLTSNREHSGVFELSAFGSVSTKAAWTRSEDFATSENFSGGATVLTAGEQGSWQILRSTADEYFVLDTDPAIFELINPAWLLANGFSSLTAPSGGGNAPAGTALIADGSGLHQSTSAPVSDLLAATSSLEMREALDAYSTTETDDADAAVLTAAQTYADNALQGFVSKGSVRVVLSSTSLATLLGGCSYNSGTKRLTADNNGAIGTVDTVSDLEVDQLIGVPKLTGSDARYNGPWRLIQIGDAGTPTILQRATNFDSSSDIKASSYYLVEDGLDYGGNIFQLTTEGPYTLDTTELTWTRRRINLMLSDATPAPLGTATPGTSGEASRRDHAHAIPSAADVGAPALSTLTTRGDLYVRGASAVARLALDVAKRILSSDGTDVVYQTIASLLTDVGDTRGQILRRGASAWEALNAKEVNYFLVGNGVDLLSIAPASAWTAIGLGAFTATGASAAAARSAIGAGEDAMPFVRTLAGLCLPTGLTDATLWLDEAQIPRVASGTTLTSWPARIGASAGSPAGAAVKVRTTNGLYEAAWETADGSLLCAMNPGAGATPRTLVVVALNVSPTGSTKHVLHYGSGALNQAYGITCKRSTSFFWGNHYWSTFPDSTAVPTIAAQSYINAYDGTVDRFYFNGATAGTSTVTLNTGAGAGLYLGSRIGTTEGWLGSMRLVLAYPRCLSATEVATLHAWFVLRGLV